MAPLRGRIIDAWMQHPTDRFRAQPMLDTLRRWLLTANLAVVAGHIGFPWTLEMISLAMQDPNVYIDTSAY